MYLEKIFQKIKMLIALGKQTMFVIFSREKEIVYGYWFSGFSKFTYYTYILKWQLEKYLVTNKFCCVLLAFLSSCAGIQTRYHFLKKFKALPFQNSFKGKWEHWKKTM